MPNLLSGSRLRSGGSGDFLKLEDAMPQLPATETTLTGFTIATDPVLRTSYRSSLGFVEFTTSSMYSALPDGIVYVLATGTHYASTTTSTGNLVVQGGIGVGANMTVEDDITVNRITIGRGWEAGPNNIVIRGDADPQVTTFNDGQESIAIGFDTQLGLSTAYKNISIGRYALSSGTRISNSIAIGDSALKLIGTVPFITIGAITSATQTSPVRLTVANHNINTGTNVVVSGIGGMVELEGNPYWVTVLDTNTLELYNDNILSSPLDGTGFAAYTSGGTLGRVISRTNNIAIGNNAAESLIDGQKNFFFGDQIAKNLTTGSNNFFIGNDVGNNLSNVSGTISIGSDNLVDNVNNQVAIGSVFYFDGSYDASINSDLEVGVGTNSTSTVTGALTVVGGVGITDDVYVGGTLNLVNTQTAINSYGSIIPIGSGVNLGSPSNPFNALYLKGTTLYLSTVTLKSYNSQDFTIESPAGAVRQTVGNLTLNSGEPSNGYTSGSLLVSGGVGIAGDVNINGQLNVTGVEDVTLSPAGADVYIQPTLGGTILIEPVATGNIDNIIIGANNPADGTFDSLSGNNLNITALTNSTSTSTGAVTVNGGVGIKGNVYAATGNPDENYLLYTPRSTVSLTSPTNPRVGDFWINPSGPYFLQYVQDGPNKVWVQI